MIPLTPRLKIVLPVGAVLIVALAAVLAVKFSSPNEPAPVNQPAGPINSNANTNLPIELGNINTNQPVPKPGGTTTKPGDSIIKLPPPEPSNLTAVQKELLSQLKAAADKRDYATFAQYLKMVYQKQWEGIKDFGAVESELYMYAVNTYYAKADYATSLGISTMVYNVVPQGWRFRYLRIITLEKLGRQALDKNDLVGAANYAITILQMTYRPEGANLLADVYIKKIETSLASGDKQQAASDYAYIKDYEVSADRRAKLDQLAARTAK